MEGFLYVNMIIAAVNYVSEKGGNTFRCYMICYYLVVSSAVNRRARISGSHFVASQHCYARVSHDYISSTRNDITNINGVVSGGTLIVSQWKNLVSVHF